PPLVAGGLLRRQVDAGEVAHAGGDAVDALLSAQRRLHARSGIGEAVEQLRPQDDGGALEGDPLRRLEAEVGLGADADRREGAHGMTTAADAQATRAAGRSAGVQPSRSGCSRSTETLTGSSPSRPRLARPAAQTASHR